MGKVDTLKIAKTGPLEKNIYVFRFTYLEEYSIDWRN